MNEQVMKKLAIKILNNSFFGSQVNLYRVDKEGIAHFIANTIKQKEYEEQTMTFEEYGLTYDFRRPIHDLMVVIDFIDSFDESLSIDDITHRDGLPKAVEVFSYLMELHSTENSVRGEVSENDPLRSEWRTFEDEMPELLDKYQGKETELVSGCSVINFARLMDLLTEVQFGLTKLKFHDEVVNAKMKHLANKFNILRIKTDRDYATIPRELIEGTL
jgi:hypothetical protein